MLHVCQKRRQQIAWTPGAYTQAAHHRIGGGESHHGGGHSSLAPAITARPQLQPALLEDADRGGVPPCCSTTSASIDLCRTRAQQLHNRCRLGAEKDKVKYPPSQELVRPEGAPNRTDGYCLALTWGHDTQNFLAFI